LILVVWIPPAVFPLVGMVLAQRVAGFLQVLQGRGFRFRSVVGAGRRAG